MEKISEILRRTVLEAIKKGQARYSIARAANIDPAALNKWLADDDREIRSSTIDALCDLFGLTLTPIPAPKSRKADA